MYDDYDEEDKFEEFIKDIDDRLDADICYIVLVVLGGILSLVTFLAIL